MRTRPLVVTALSISLLSLAACSSSSSGGGSTKASNGSTAKKASSIVDYNPQPWSKLKDGGTYTSSGSFDGDDTQGNPWNVNTSLTGSRIWAWYNPDAITYSPTGAVRINPDYYTSATSKIVGGHQVVTITINPKAVYNDGTPIDWRSIEATWKVSNGTNPKYQIPTSQGYDQITSVKQGKDAKQAVVTFRKAYAAWPSLFGTFINPKAATVSNFNTAYSNKMHPEWGAGPFTVESYDSNSKKIVFKRNPKWWGKTGRLTKRIYLDLPNSQAEVNSFRNDQVDYTATGDADTLNQIKGVPGTEIRQGGSPFVYSLFLNGKSPTLKDVQVRKAVEQAVDRAQIAKIQFQGLNYSEPLPGSQLFYSFQKGYSDNVAKVLKPGADQAKKTLEADGWKQGKNGIFAKGGKTLQVTYILYESDPLSKATASSVQASLKNAGIKVNIKTIDEGQWQSTINGGKFDLIISGNRSMNPFGATQLSAFYRSTDGANITRVGNAALNKEIDAVNNIADSAEQVKQANIVEQHALALYSTLPLYSGPSIYGVKKGLANVGATIFDSPLPETIGYVK
jgi:peptide/nickel transport system substrate-binding protein